MEIGAMIRECRHRTGTSQGDIELSTGIERANLSRIENGVTQPRIDTLQKILSAMGITLSEFFADDREAP
jgi:transcriptional regulator with XRE-family HTH domain